MGDAAGRLGAGFPVTKPRMEMEDTVLTRIRSLGETALDKGDESSDPQACQWARAVQASHFVPVLVVPQVLRTRTLLAMVLVGYDCLSHASLSMQ